MLCPNKFFPFMNKQHLWTKAITNYGTEERTEKRLFRKLSTQVITVFVSISESNRGNAWILQTIIRFNFC